MVEVEPLPVEEWVELVVGMVVELVFQPPEPLSVLV
jgi:hypothetical protein